MDKKGDKGMKSKVLKTITSGVLAVGLIMGSSLNTFAAYEELNVSVLEQQDTNWCWAASALMAGEYAYSACDKSQADLVKHVKGSVVNKTGSIWDVENAAEYATNDTLGLSALLGRWSLSKIRGAIDKDYPVIIRIETNISSGHFLVVRGYNTSNDNLVINDPWTQTREIGSYSDLVAGKWAHDTRKYANTVYFNNSK